jgi:hypothetical protein
MAKKSGGGKEMRIGRSAITGRFTDVKRAQSSPKTHIVETIKLKKASRHPGPRPPRGRSK